MKIIVAHNRYQLAGGEDTVVSDEIALLRSQGHEVIEFMRDNSSIHNGASSWRAALSNIWSFSSYEAIANVIASEKPDILHVHNVTPLISASIFWAANRLGVPVVQTLHNVRGMCLNGLFLREERVCEDCKGRVPWRGVARACYRGSVSASAALAASTVAHRAVGTIENRIQRFIALSESSRRRFIEGGYPAGRVVVKPNFAAAQRRPSGERDGFLFVGRLSVEKGARVLGDALSQDKEIAAGFRIVGNGPELEYLRGCVPEANLLGIQSREKVIELMATSSAVVVPSICYENFPKVIVEAFSVGTPVIASNLGALGELVEEGHTGLLFCAGDPVSLIASLRRAQACQSSMSRLGRNALEEYERKYTPAANYRKLMSIYAEAIEDGLHASAGVSDSGDNCADDAL